MTKRSAIYNYAAELARRCSADYDAYLYAHFERASEACKNRLLNKRGMSKSGLQSWSLFDGVGHHSRARAYASEELRDFWEREPLLTKERFEAQWLEAERGTG